MSVTSTASFHLSDSLLNGGNNGIGITPKSPSFQAVLTNTSIRNMKSGALVGGFGGVSASFHMTGGELSNTSATAVQIGPGVWTFTGVTFKQNRDFTIYLQDGSVVMRACTVTGNGGGVDVFVIPPPIWAPVTAPATTYFRTPVLASRLKAASA